MFNQFKLSMIKTQGSRGQESEESEVRRKKDDATDAEKRSWWVLLQLNSL